MDNAKSTHSDHWLRCLTLCEVAFPGKHGCLHPRHVLARGLKLKVHICDDSLPSIGCLAHPLSLFLEVGLEIYVGSPSLTNLVLSFLLPLLNCSQASVPSLLFSLHFRLLLLKALLHACLSPLFSLLDEFQLLLVVLFTVGADHGAGGSLSEWLALVETKLLLLSTEWVLSSKCILLLPAHLRSTIRRLTHKSWCLGSSCSHEITFVRKCILFFWLSSGSLSKSLLAGSLRGCSLRL